MNLRINYGRVQGATGDVDTMLFSWTQIYAPTPYPVLNW